MDPLALAVSLPIAVVGIYYLVWASTAAELESVEGHRINRLRVRLRRLNGLILVLVAMAMYLLVSRSMFLETGERPGLVGPIALLAMIPLVFVMSVLAYLDLYLTRKLGQNLPRPKRDRRDDQNRPAAILFVLPVLLLLGGCGEAESGVPATNASLTLGSGSPDGPDEPDEPDEDPRAQKLDTVEMKIGDETFTLMLANDEAERTVGLMFRRSLGKNQGMIFVFPWEAERGFWMKNTYIPLDIIYLDAEATVLNVEQMAAHDRRSKYSAGAAKYAIELPLNTAKRLKVTAGQTLKIPDKARETDK